MCQNPWRDQPIHHKDHTRYVESWILDSWAKSQKCDYGLPRILEVELEFSFSEFTPHITPRAAADIYLERADLRHVKLLSSITTLCAIKDFYMYFYVVGHSANEHLVEGVYKDPKTL